MVEYQTLLLAAVNALCCGVGLGVTLKTDIRWLRLMMEKLEERVTKLEDRV
ncbi:hypothetical protein ACK1CN_21640 [Vibrio coralliilyticus]|jgi:hypothetical protein|uniref:hypothetical protein n=1 Tax=Vibrio TaxID=662 RepID=UPI00031FFDB2|nr:MULTISPECIES: hypothetical protein [Vibrio]ERB66524.1 hypothetical protein N779_04100 [Vibrio coralliilyticus OCN008]NRF16316.1 hypothetical protein [Vibrio coralliilyticus]NRF25509.1 hypothetical protein [Vibrio coralliilyticus]NRF79864.1 hypothetical protein [Vibrio coralliilyticus]